ncbi:MAG: hypothetical protein M1819_006333 [Sarea resinae]|nr:MAG: hypothetical protein M1819_006333 [Sarea resinae]
MIASAHFELQGHASPSGTVQICINDLAPEHLVALEKALSNILSTDLAFQTFAQVVDGVPTRDVYRDYYTHTRPDFEQNVESSRDARQVVEAFRANLRLGMIEFDAKLAEAYQNTTIGSRQFILRLMELVSIACHNMATSLFINADGGLHKLDPTSPSAQPPTHPDLPPLMPIPPKPVELYHPEYMDWDQYPNGIADIVGYWAEYRLFGGVMLFDRGESGIECENVFVHPVGFYQIYELSDAQIQDFANFALSELASHSNENPERQRFHAEKYARRIDPYVAMSLHIDRNNYERKIPTSRPRRCVYHQEDFPELADELAKFADRHK